MNPLLDTARESEARFRLAFDHAASGLALLNDDHRFVQVNPKLTAVLGLTESDLLGRHLTDVVHVGDRHSAVEHQRLLRAEGGPVRWETRIVRPDGRVAWIAVTLTRVPETVEEPPFVLCSVEDTSAARAQEQERRRVEEQLRRAQRMEAVGRLAGGVAHEFNNMLSVILNNLDFAERRVGDDGTKRHLAAVRAAALHSSSLVRQLMVFGRCDVAAPQVLDVNELATGLDAVLKRMLGPDIEFESSFDPEVSRVYLTASHAEQILLNLAVNAKEAMPRGGRLTLTTADVELDSSAVRSRLGLRPGRYVQIVVEDTGIGMTPEVLARAFEPFFTTKQPGDGPGLGLSIVYGIVEEAGGHVSVESAPGAGARFEILLPATDLAPRRRRADLQGPPPRGKGERVLVVEDEPAVRDLTVLILKENGYETWTVAGPEEALQKLMNDQAPLDLLVTDVIMPRLSGTDLAAYVRALRPSAKVLFMSGRADEHIGRQRVRDGEVAFLQKPFDTDGLLRAVREVLDGAAAERPGRAGA